jgi:hypothetical protein
MNWIRILSLVWVINACATCGYVRDYPNDEIKDIVERYEAEISPVGSLRVVMVDNLEEDTNIGLCEIFPFEATKISLLKSYWSMATDSEKEQLLYHELTHALNVDHDDRIDDYGRKLSVMNSNIIMDYEYKEYREEYMRDLRDKVGTQ